MDAISGCYEEYKILKNVNFHYHNRSQSQIIVVRDFFESIIFN
jgi:hypothetical protein